METSWYILGMFLAMRGLTCYSRVQCGKKAYSITFCQLFVCFARCVYVSVPSLPVGQVSDCSSSSRRPHTGQSLRSRSQDARGGRNSPCYRVVARDTSLQTVRFATLFVTVAVKWAICPRCAVATAGGAPRQHF